MGLDYSYRLIPSLQPGGVVGLAVAQLPSGDAMLVSSGDEPSVQVRTLPDGRISGESLPVAGKVRALAVHDAAEPLVAVAGAGIAVARLRPDHPDESRG